MWGVSVWTLQGHLRSRSFHGGSWVAPPVQERAARLAAPSGVQGLEHKSAEECLRDLAGFISTRKGKFSLITGSHLSAAAGQFSSVHTPVPGQSRLPPPWLPLSERPSRRGKLRLPCDPPSLCAGRLPRQQRAGNDQPVSRGAGRRERGSGSASLWAVEQNGWCCW